MPSIFGRRRASESTVTPSDANSPTLTSSQSKLKSFFVPDKNKMKKRLSLSSPSAFFNQEIDHSTMSQTGTNNNSNRRARANTITPTFENHSNSVSAALPTSGQSPKSSAVGINGSANGLYVSSQGPSPSRPISIASPLPSISVLTGGDNGQSTLAGSSSSPFNSNGKPWRPSYPLVASNSDYADIDPDGFRQANQDKPNVSLAADENVLRRSSEFPTTLGAQELSIYPSLVPSKPSIARTSPSLASPPPSQTPPPPFRPVEAPLTPPPTATVFTKPLPTESSPATTQPTTPNTDTMAAASTSYLTPSDVSRVFNGSEELGGQESSGSPESPSLTTLPETAQFKRDRRPMLTLSISDSSPAAATAPTAQPIAASSTPPSTISPLQTTSNASLEMNNRKPSFVIQSPPMPRPIANLPTLTPIGAMTPSWGLLAREGGPKTPGFGPPAPRTPGSSGAGSSMGFPFFAPTSKKKSTLTEAELRKVAKTMPGLTREPSQQILDDDGGDAGDDDEESDTEIESPNQAEDENNEDADGERRGGLLRSIARPRGAVVPRTTMDIVHEEEPAGTIADRRHISAPKVDLHGIRPMIMGSASQKSVWNLPTPGKQHPVYAEHGAWMQFESDTPRATPMLTPGLAIPSVPSTPAIAAQTAGPRALGEYFMGSPLSATERPSTIPPMPLASPRISGEVGVGGAADSESEDDSDRDSVEGTEESPSVVEHVSPPNLTPSPVNNNTSRPPSVPPVPSLPSTSPTRPALYSQVSVSMINLPTSRRGSQDDDDTTVMNPSPAIVSQNPSINTTGAINSSGVDIRPIRERRNMPRLDTIPSEGSVSRATRTPATTVTSPTINSPTIDAWMIPPPTPSIPIGSSNGFFGAPQIKRRRSADAINALPPRYEPPFPGVYIPRPREEEGREKLPGYSCGVHIEGWMQRKQEFIQPQIPSKQRSWKRVYCVLHGTQFLVYKFDPRKIPPIIGRGQPMVYEVTEAEAEQYEHVYLPGQIGGRPVPPPPPPAPSSGAAGARRASVASTSGGIIQLGPRGRSSSASNNQPGDRTSGSSSRRSSLSALGTSTSSSSSATGTGSPSASSSPMNLSSTTSSGIGLSSFSATNTMSSPNPISSDKERNLFPASGTGQSGSYVTNPTARRASVSSLNNQNQTGPLASHLPFAHNQIIDQVSLQQAESGLAVDYKKRKNVLRVRAKGYQFLLQADTFSETICWIEAFQAATAISLDLDERPMPKVQQLPRRRRRRPANAGTSAEVPANASANASSRNSLSGPTDPHQSTEDAAINAVRNNEGTPQGNMRAITAMDRMLAEDQAEERQTVA